MPKWIRDKNSIIGACIFVIANLLINISKTTFIKPNLEDISSWTTTAKNSQKIRIMVLGDIGNNLAFADWSSFVMAPWWVAYVQFPFISIKVKKQ